jgi:hypothetical protein
MLDAMMNERDDDPVAVYDAQGWEKTRRNFEILCYLHTADHTVNPYQWLAMMRDKPKREIA